MNRIGYRLGRMAALVTLGSSIMMAQGTQTGSMTATIVDKSGKLVVGAEVRLTSPSLQGERVAQSDSQGRAVVRLLPPGAYRILVRKEGFQTVTLNERIGLEQSFSPRVVLAGEATATVVVVAAETGVDKTETKTAYNYTKEMIDSLPVQRTDQLQAAYLTPGVSENVNSDKGGIEIRGSQGTGNLVLVDGQNTMDNIYVGQRIGVIMDAIEETQVLTGAIPAEYGYIEGGVINSITKSGGNDLTATLRWDLHNENWNAMKPKQPRGGVVDKTFQERSLTVGGPILKDKLWFFLAGFDAHPSQPLALNGQVANLPVVDYLEMKNDYRREVKFTFSPTSTQTFTATYNNSSLAYNRDAAGAGELAAISNFVTKGEFWGLGWRGILSESLVMSAHIGGKTQTFGGTANPLMYGPPIYNYADGQQYAAPVWDPNDPQPDDRRNQTANFKLSAFWNAAGSHETDFGLDYYKGTTKASGYQSPAFINAPGIGLLNLWYIGVDNYDGAARTAEIIDYDGLTYDVMVGMKYVPDTATVTTNGLYFNDKWTLNEKVNFNIGLRYDNYEAKNTSQGKLASNGTLSPRLGVKYDLLGDATWVVGASFSRLQGRPLETQFNNGGYVNNPITYTFSTTLAPGTYSLAQIANIASWNTTPGPGGYTVSDAAYNIKFDPHLKPQMVDEKQLTFTWNFKSNLLGNGYVRSTLVQKDWSNLVDVSVGPNGTVTDPSGNVLDIHYYHNEPLAHRSYKAMELDAALNKGNLKLSGNVTWSRIEGNYVGEGKSTPGAAPGMQTYNVINNAFVYDPAAFYPTGRLVTAGSQSPLSINGVAEYGVDSRLGKTSFGLVYRFRSGQTYDIARTLHLSYLPGIIASDNPAALNSSVVQYMNNARGTGVFNPTANIDFSITQDFTLVKLASGRQVTGYVRLMATNLFNHQQDAYWDTSYAPATDPRDPWVATNSATFGSPRSSADYAEARRLYISMGLKF